jgi:HD-like signal output (HDOD) protein
MSPDELPRASLQVPSITPDASRLLFKIMDPDVDVPTLKTELHNVSSIVAKLIALANSAWSKPITPITDLDAAFMRLGLNVVRTVSLGLVVGKSLDTTRCQNFDPIRFWSSSMVCSDTSALLSGHFGIETNTARTIGLLHNLGLLLLADRYPEELNVALSEATAGSLDELLESRCGFGYWDAGYRLLEHWGLPNIIVSALQDRSELDAPELVAASDLVHLSADLSNKVTRQEALGDSPSTFIDPLTLRTVYDTQVSNYESTIELTRTLFA